MTSIIVSEFLQYAALHWVYFLLPGILSSQLEGQEYVFHIIQSS